MKQQFLQEIRELELTIEQLHRIFQLEEQRLVALRKTCDHRAPNDLPYIGPCPHNTSPPNLQECKICGMLLDYEQVRQLQDPRP